VDGPVEELAAVVDDRVEALRVGAAGRSVGAEAEQGSATADFAAARAAPVREAAELAADLPTAVPREVAIVRPFNPFRDPANPVLADQRQTREIRIRVDQILLDPERRDLIVPVLANRVIDQATAIGLVTDRVSLEKGTALAIGRGMATVPVPDRAMVIGPATSRAMVIGPATSRAMAIGPATSRAMAIGPATSRAMAIGPATSRAMVTAPATSRVMATGPATSRAMVTAPATSRVMATDRGIDPATVRGFTPRLTATDLATVRAIVPITVTDRDPASPAIPIIQAAAVRRTGTDIGSRSITVGITAPGTGTGITAAPIGTPIRGARGA
jgi:hypothetical protein